MPSVAVDKSATFAFLVPSVNVTVGPAGNPWRPALYTVDLAAIAGSATWGSITGTLGDQADLSAALALKAPLASPAFTGNPTATTQAPGDNSARLATTAFVTAAIAAAPAETLAATLLAGNTTGARDIVVDGGQAVRGAAATTLTLVGPAGLSATATVGALALAASSGSASLSGSTTLGLTGGTGLTATATTGAFVAQASGGSFAASASTTANMTGGTGAGVTATTGALALAAPAGAASLTASAAASVTGGTGFTATATTGAAAMNATAGAANISAATTSTIATGTGASVTTTAADTTAVLTLTSGGANGAATSVHAGTRDPEGNVTANTGAIYRRNTGTAGEGYLKASGAGNTGWQRIGNWSIIDRATTDLTVNGTAAETTIYSFSVPAGALGANGVLAVWLTGTFVTTALSASYTLRFYFGGVEIYEDASPSITLSAVLRAWNYDVCLFNRNATNSQRGGGVCTISGGGTAATGVGSFGNTSPGNTPIIFGASAIDTTAAQTFAVTTQHSGASAGITTVRVGGYAAISRST